MRRSEYIRHGYVFWNETSKRRWYAVTSVDSAMEDGRIGRPRKIREPRHMANVSSAREMFAEGLRSRAPEFNAEK